MQEAVDYHRDLNIPIRFGVLCGEVIHHLRSCLDHIVWHFSSAQYRLEHPDAIEFPILRMPPTKTNELSRYQRKIDGVTNANVVRLIEGLQPYHRGNDAINDPLCIVHDMDRFDKHRALVVIGGCASVRPLSGGGGIAVQALLKLSHGETLSEFEAAIADKALKKDVKVTPQIAFAQFGNRKTEMVIPALSQLQNV